MPSSLVDELDPEIVAYTELLNRGALPLATSTVAELRAGARKLRLSWPRGPAMHATVESEFAGHRVRIHRPSAAERLPAIVFFHGGGWTLMDIDTHDAIARGLAQASGAAILLVDYPLAPEHPFPAGLDVCQAFAEHVRASADALALVPDRIAFAGDSAGANLAVAVALRLRDAGRPLPQAMALFYGAYDTGLDRPSWRKFGNGDLPFSRERMTYFVDAYVPTPAARADPLFASLHADVRGLPPAILAVGSHDGLLDDSVTMAERLQAAGVPATLKVYPGAVHGFIEAASAVGAKVARQALLDCGRFIAAAVAA
jgi:acetyl esterase